MNAKKRYPYVMNTLTATIYPAPTAVSVRTVTMATARAAKVCQLAK